ncbi:MAG: ATPase [Alphaproteobacteria bacterium]|nr:ATPase [Alphaproteobacteria bacterium]
MTSRVVVSLRVAASPERAFAVFTEEIGEWWVHDPMFRLTPRSPGEMAFEPPDANGKGGRLIERLPTGKVFEVGQVRAWTPGERLVVGWRQASFGPEHATEVEVSFEPVGDETRITVEHRGWDSVPQDHVARHTFPLPLFLQHQGANWRAGLAALGGRLAK